MLKLTISKKYYDDVTWAYRHFPQWKNKYGNRWIAVLNHKVVADGDNVCDVANRLSKKDIDAKAASILFVEKGAYVY